MAIAAARCWAETCRTDPSLTRCTLDQSIAAHIHRPSNGRYIILLALISRLSTFLVISLHIELVQSSWQLTFTTCRAYIVFQETYLQKRSRKGVVPDLKARKHFRGSKPPTRTRAWYYMVSGDVDIITIHFQSIFSRFTRTLASI